jgi:hypothetical protein
MRLAVHVECMSGNINAKKLPEIPDGIDLLRVVRISGKIILK